MKLRVRNPERNGDNITHDLHPGDEISIETSEVGRGLTIKVGKNGILQIEKNVPKKGPRLLVVVPDEQTE